MRAAQAGDGVAYEALLRALLPPLNRFVARVASDPSEVDDIVQSVLLSIHRARHTWRPERPFGPWWRTIARNAAIDASRARGRRREISLDPAHEMTAPPTSSPSEMTIDPEVAAALAALPPGQREAIDLVHGQDLSVAEAAARAGVNQSALKVRVHRGISAMRRVLGGRRP